MIRSPKWSLPFRSSDMYLVCISHLLYIYIYIVPSDFILLDLVILVMFDEGYELRTNNYTILFSLFSFLSLLFLLLRGSTVLEEPWLSHFF